MSFTTISVIGLGYIGLPTAAAFASRQKHVIGVDVNQHAVDSLNRRRLSGLPNRWPHGWLKCVLI